MPTLRRCFIALMLVGFSAAVAVAQSGQATFVYQNNFWVASPIDLAHPARERCQNLIWAERGAGVEQHRRGGIVGASLVVVRPATTIGTPPGSYNPAT